MEKEIIKQTKDIFGQIPPAKVVKKQKIKESQKEPAVKVKNKKSAELTTITDIWTQSVVYYYIWLEFGVEVPHNDYSDWFTNTDDIVKMLNKLGVTV